MKYLFSSFMLLLAFYSHADVKFGNNFKNNPYGKEIFSVFVKQEFSGGDHISAVGVSTLFKGNNSNFVFSMNTSIGHAEVTDTLGQEQGYLAWEGGMKVGYFSSIFIYLEAGVDLGELALNDRDEDGHYDRNTNVEISNGHNDSLFNIDRTRRSDDLDGYLGLGAGVDLGNIELEAFVRFRQIDGEYWRAENQTFTGAQLSLSF